jgi:hypothetical protein
LGQLRKSYRNEPQNTTTHCTRCLKVSKSGEPKIWTIVQIFGLARKARAMVLVLWFALKRGNQRCELRLQSSHSLAENNEEEV